MTSKQFYAYRGEKFAYDLAYLKERKPKANCMLVKELVDGSTSFPPDVNILSVDTIYYPGVMDAIKTHLALYPAAKAMLIFNAYDSKEGSFPLYYDNGTY